MNAHIDWDVLNDYADERLDASARAAITAHLATCAACSEQLARLRNVLSAARASTPDVEPPAGAWDAIRSEIELGKVVPLPGTTSARASRRNVLRVAAALLLVAGSSAITIAIMDSRETDVAVTGDSGSGGVIPVSLAQIERSYADDLRELAAVLEESRARLAPETVEAVERSLRIIDEAIAEARAAVLRDPASALLQDMLTRGYQQKVDLLRRISERVKTT
jgi:hypothetical protein